MQRSSATRPSMRARFVAGVVGAAAITALAIPVLAGPAAAASLGSSRPVTTAPPVTVPAPGTSTTPATAPDPALQAAVTKPGKPVQPSGRRW
jgi:hypothetical protein